MTTIELYYTTFWLAWHEQVDNTETKREVVLKDIHETDYKIEQVAEEKYLGDVISKDGKNSKNIKFRVTKEMGSKRLALVTSTSK